MCRRRFLVTALRVLPAHSRASESHNAWTNHDLDTAMSYIADDIVCDTPPDRLEGARAY